MGNPVFKGLSSDEIVMIYKFIVVTGPIVSNETDERIKEKFPKAQNWEKVINREDLLFEKTVKCLNEKIKHPNSKLHMQRLEVQRLNP